MQKLNDQTGAAPTAIVQSVCVYCGSGKGLTPSYAVAARKLGQTLASHNIRLIYGGGSLGLMGEVARSALEAGGKVTGIIPEFLGSKEKMLKDVDELIVADAAWKRNECVGALKHQAFADVHVIDHDQLIDVFEHLFLGA